MSLVLDGSLGVVLGTTNTAAVPGLIHGVNLAAAGSTTSFTVGSGYATDSTHTSRMYLSSNYTKTTGAWAVGNGNGSLDVGTTGNSLWYHTYLIQKNDLSVVDVLTSLANDNSGVVTITIATPGVVTWADHGLQIGSPVVFTTTGALPTGITAGTVYYVISAGFAVDSFQIGATQGGAAINTTGSQSGVHTGTSAPIMPATYTYRRRIASMKTNGSAQWVAFTQDGNLFQWLTPVLDVSDTNPATTLLTKTLASVPTGIRVEARLNIQPTWVSTANMLYIHDLSVVDLSASTSVAPLGTAGSVGGGTGQNPGTQQDVYTNKSAQIGYRLFIASGASDVIRMTTLGWIDSRGSSPMNSSGSSLPIGTILQQVSTRTSSMTTGTTLMINDNTIPQSGEGDQFLSLAITPRSATSVLYFRIVLYVSHTVGTANAVAGLFQDSTANALSSGSVMMPTANGGYPLVLDYYMTSGTTSSTTFKVRVGGNAAGTLTINGWNSTAYFGGTMYSSMTITEVVS